MFDTTTHPMTVRSAVFHTLLLLTVGVLGTLMSASPTLAATIAVNLNGDDLSSGQKGLGIGCGLDDAINSANDDVAYGLCTAGSGRDTIVFELAGSFLLLADDLPAITEDVDIFGPGADKLVLDAAGMVLFEVDTADVKISGLTLTNGLSDGGGCLAAYDSTVEVNDMVFLDCASANSGGGAIRVREGSMVVARTTFFSNATEGSGGAIQAGSGAVLEIVDSSFLGNESTEIGGALAAVSSAVVTVSKSTFTGNAAADDGGAIAVLGSSTELALTSCTLAGNVADSDADDFGDGGGLYVNSAGSLVSLTNTLVALNEDRSDPGQTGEDPRNDIDIPAASAVSTGGTNFLGDNTGSDALFEVGSPNALGDWVGDASTPLDPQIGPLGDHGGPTFTHVPTEASPLIDQGNCPSEAADQRGVSNGEGGRAVDRDPADAHDGCDIGAVEYSPLLSDGFESGDLSAWSSSVG